MQFRGLISPDMMKKSQVNISEKQVELRKLWNARYVHLIGRMDNDLDGSGRMCAVAINMPN
jgi:hypothetical protein